jgi:putative aminopeptidase FrvX
MKARAVAALILGFAAAGIASAQEETGAWALFKKLVHVPGVSGQEGRVADFVRGSLPPDLKVDRDGMNNVWFTIGSGSPHLLFVAHTDELGWTVSAVTPEGRVKVKPVGSMLPRAAEGRAVVIHTDKGPVPGVVAPRKGYGERRSGSAPPPPFRVEDYEIYLGVDSEKDARALGVADGCPVINRKHLVELGPEIIATRAVDDRAGCAALLDAVLRLDRKRVRGKTVTFAWDVQEETGLFGASALAKTLAPDVVFAVDTFVSTDSPLESKRFGNLPLGAGAVVRAIDSSSIAPQAAVRRILDIARRRGIPVQVGNARGGNDGSVFLPGGSVDIPLSWPGVYSHSFIEKVHRRDLEALADLILAVVEDWKD